MHRTARRVATKTVTSSMSAPVTTTMRAVCRARITPGRRTSASPASSRWGRSSLCPRSCEFFAVARLASTLRRRRAVPYARLVFFAVDAAHARAFNLRGEFFAVARLASPAASVFHMSIAVHARARRRARSDITGSRRYVTRVYPAAEQTEDISRLDYVPLGRRSKVSTNAPGGVVGVIDVEDIMNQTSNTTGIQTATYAFEMAARHALPARASLRLTRHVYGDGDERIPRRRAMTTREKRTPKRFAFRHTSRHIRDKKRTSLTVYDPSF